MLEFLLLRIGVFSPPFMCNQNIFIHNIIRKSIISIIEHIQTFLFVKLISIKKMQSIQSILVNGQFFLVKKKKEKKKVSFIFFALGSKNDWTALVNIYPYLKRRENSYGNCSSKLQHHFKDSQTVSNGLSKKLLSFLEELEIPKDVQSFLLISLSLVVQSTLQNTKSKIP